MSRRLVSMFFVAVVALAPVACSTADNGAAPPSGPTAADPILAAYDLAGLDGPALVDRLERVPVAQRQSDLRASVRPAEVLLTDQRTGAQATVPLPVDRFYLSIAPYLGQTHDCFFHSLTTCRGELSGQPVAVQITDRATGETLIDTTVTTFDNGFAGFWLPRDITATVRVEYGGRSASAEVGTGPDDATCLTTLLLS